MPKPRRTSKTPADTRTTEQRLTEEAEWRTKDFVESIVKMIGTLTWAMRDIESAVRRFKEATPGVANMIDTGPALDAATHVQAALLAILPNCRLDSIITHAVSLDRVTAQLAALTPPESMDEELTNA